MWGILVDCGGAKRPCVGYSGSSCGGAKRPHVGYSGGLWRRELKRPYMGYSDILCGSAKHFLTICVTSIFLQIEMFQHCKKKNENYRKEIVENFTLKD